MKICTRCNNTVQDNEEFCSRCGGRNFTSAGQGQGQQRPQQGQPMQRPQQGQQMQRPQQGQPMQQRPQQMRPQQGQQMQRPQQGQPMQRPQQGQQMQRPQQGQPMQRPQQMQQRPQQMQQNQNTGFDNGYQQNQDFGQGFDNQQDMFPDEPVQKKKGLFGKGKKANLAKEQSQQMQNNNQGFVDNNFGPAVQPASEDGSSVGDWIKTMLILIIPIYGLIKYFTGMKDMSQPAYKRNYYKAFLIYFAACIVISIVFSIVLGGIMGAALAGLG